eukprot:scaffold29490_cov63-Phaeocystis_antarctica.AAC.2
MGKSQQHRQSMLAPVDKWDTGARLSENCPLLATTPAATFATTLDAALAVGAVCCSEQCTGVASSSVPFPRSPSASATLRAKP